MNTVTWKRRKVEQAYGMGGGTTVKAHTEHVAVVNGKEIALRSVDGLFFLYIDGAQSKHRTFFDTLKAGKAAVSKIA